MKEINESENYSDEVQDIMSFIPNLVIRWGMSVLAIIFLTILAGSFIFKSPEIISAPMVLTTKNPPIALISKSTGKIDRLFVTEGQEVNEKDKIALINSPTDFNDYLLLKKELASCSAIPDWNEQVLAITLDEHLTLGDLQLTYGPFLKSRNNLRHYLIQNYLPQKIILVEKQIVKQNEYYQTLIRQKDIELKDLLLSERGFNRDSTLYQKRTISEADYEKSRQQFLTKKSSYIGYEAVLRETETAILQLQASKVELQMQHDRELADFRLILDEAKQNLESDIHKWKRNIL